MAPSQHGVTRLLPAWSDGDRSAIENLTALVTAELHRLAKLYMARERCAHSLQATVLVNEAYLRLVDWKDVQWQNRAHFFTVSAQMMRRILVDFARSRRHAKRGGNAQPLPLEEAAPVSNGRDRDFVMLDDALKSLAEVDPRKSRIVELKFFGGLSARTLSPHRHAGMKPRQGVAVQGEVSTRK